MDIEEIKDMFKNKKYKVNNIEINNDRVKMLAQLDDKKQFVNVDIENIKDIEFTLDCVFIE